MRIVNPRQRGQIILQYVVIIVLANRPYHARITASDDFDDLLGFLFIELFLQIFVAQALAPELFGFGQVLRAREVFTFEHESIVAGEIEFLSFEQPHDILILLFEPLAKARKNDASRAGVTRFGQVVEGGAIFLEFLQVGLKKENVEVIESVQVTVQKLRGQLVIKGPPEVMRVLKNRCGHPGDIFVVLSFDQRDCIRELAGD